MAKKAFEGLTESMFYILMAFGQGEMCGIEIAEYVATKTCDRVSIGPGTLYTILARFEEEGFIAQTAVSGRKRTYEITQKGRQVYNTELGRLKMCLKDAEGVRL